MGFFELVFVGTTNGQDRRHVGLVERGQHSGRILGLYKTTRNRLAQIAHLFGPHIA